MFNCENISYSIQKMLEKNWAFKKDKNIPLVIILKV